MFLHVRRGAGYELINMNYVQRILPVDDQSCQAIMGDGRTVQLDHSLQAIREHLLRVHPGALPDLMTPAR